MDKKIKKILIVNVWGGNRGDEAMVNSLARILRSVFLDCDISVLKARTETLVIDIDIHVVNYRAGEFYYNRASYFIRGIRFFNRRILHRVVLKPILRFIKFLSSYDMGFLKEFDLIISAPQGPTISDIYNLNDVTIFPLQFARKYNIPYMLLGVSMGPFNKSTKHEKKVFEILDNAKSIVLREPISFNYVKNKYPQLHNIIQSVDIVYSDDLNIHNKNKKTKDVYAAFLASLGSNNKLIGACISLTPARDPRNKFNKSLYLNKMQSFLEYVMDVSGKNLILFPHLAFDLPALRLLKLRMSNKDRVIIFPEILDSDFQQDFMNKLEFFISSRYHPTIFAIKASVPFMCIKNQFKVEGMLNKIDLNIETCWQDESLERFKEVFDVNYANRLVNLNKVKRSLDIAKKEAGKYKEVLETYLNDLK